MPKEPKKDVDKGAAKRDQRQGNSRAELSQSDQETLYADVGAQQGGRETADPDPLTPSRNKWQRFGNWRYRKLRKWRRRAPVLIALASLIVIGWQAWIYNEQRKTGNRQWQAMQETIKEMRVSRELENRAWVGVKDVDFVPNRFGGNDVILVYVNSGKSPAIVRLLYVGGERQESPPDDTNLPQAPNNQSTSALFPNVEFTGRILTLPAGVAPVVTQPQNPDHAWYLYGSLEYDDIFGHHTTKFCYRTVMYTINGKNPVVFQLAPTHNTFD